MTTSIASVRSLLAGITGPFTLTALDTPAITPLFAAYIPGPGLVIDEPEPHPGTLTLTGRATLGSAVSVPVTVTFQADGSGTTLAGLSIAFELAGFSFTAPWATFSGTALGTFGLSAPRLVLAAGSATADGRPQAAIEGARSVRAAGGTTATATLRAVIPRADLVARGRASAVLAFSADLTGVTLGDLAALAQFVAGASFGLPAELPVASSVELTQIGFVLDPVRDRVLSFSATLRSEHEIPLFGELKITSLWLSFTVFGLAGPPLEAYAEAGTTLDLYGHGVDLTVSIPDLYFTGALHQDQPVLLRPFIARLSATAADLVPENFRLARLKFGVALTAPHSFTLAVEVDDLWAVEIGTRQLSVDSVTVVLEGDGTAPPAMSIAGRITFGKANLYLSFSRAQSGNWTVAGGTVDAGRFTLPGGGTAGGIDATAFTGDLGTHFGVTAPAPVASIGLSELNLSFETGTKRFTFDCAGTFAVAQTPLAITVKVDITPKPGGFDGFFGGSLTVGSYQFTVFFDHENAKSDTFVATYADTGEDLADLHHLVAELSPTIAELVPEGIKIGLKDVKLLFIRQQAPPGPGGKPGAATTQWAVSLDLGTQISLSDIPAVGKMLSAADQTVAITGLQIGYASAPGLSDTQAAALNVLLAKNAPGVSPFVPVAAGVAFGADLVLGTETRHFQLGAASPQGAGGPAHGGPGGSGPAGPGAPAVPGAPAAASPDPVKWFDVNKQFAAFSLARIGAGYRDKILLFALDASVAVGPLALSLQALSVSSPLDTFDPAFSLDGLALDFSRPPITIAGAFLRVTQDVDGKPVTSFYGELIAGISELALKAVGGWTPDTGSFFLYAAVDVPLGGPPFLFITGLAGGFGINYSLALPSVDEAGSFVLLPGPTAPKQEAPAQTIKNLITALGKTIAPMPGEYWLAAGIEFTTFEMIRSQVVVSVEFGVEVQIGVVGVVTMTFPTGAGDAAIAHVEVDIVASFTPSTGLLAIDGKLSPESFLLGGFVKLTGGFAVRAWFSGQHRGDFVVSLGGYHPAFDWRAAGYPPVPRLGLAFSLGPLKVVGESYFALTPHAFMAGLRLSATFEAGPVKVWFDAGIDFLIEWAPFHYEAGAYVDFGCSIDLGLFTLTIHIGAQLQIWGPEFGGTAAIDLVIISFTIPFGAPKAPPPPIGWDELAAKFLPGPHPAQENAPGPAIRAAAAAPAPAADPAAGTTNVVRADVKAGKLKADVTGPGGQLDWIVDPDNFQIVTTSVIPANHAGWGTGQDADGKDIVTGLPADLASYHQGLPADSAAGRAAAMAGPAPAGLQDVYLWAEPGRPATGPAWAGTLHVAPMGQADVAAHHVVELYRLAEGGRDYDIKIAVRPVIAPSNTAIWGPLRTGGQQDQDVNAGRLIPDTLTGLEISPRPENPDQVSNVPLEALVFEHTNPASYGYAVPPAPDPGYTVTVPPHGPDSLPVTVTVSGAPAEDLHNDGYQLSSLTDPWVRDQRGAVLDELRTLGFATLAPADTDLTAMAATRLTGWPAVARIGASA